MKRSPEIVQSAFPQALTLRDTALPSLPAYWSFVVEQMTDEDLYSIADGDVGHDYLDHMAGIRRLMSAPDQAGFRMEWCPQEALSLYRWHTVVEGSSTEEAEHRRCLFSAAALLMAATAQDNSGRIMSVCENLAIVLSHHQSLNWMSRNTMLGAFLAWLEEALLPEFSDELAFVCLARGVVATWENPSRPDDAACFFHRSFAIAWEQRRESPGSCGWDDRPWSWVLKTTFFDQRDPIWRSLLEQAMTHSIDQRWHVCLTELNRLKTTLDGSQGEEGMKAQP